MKIKISVYILICILFMGFLSCSTEKKCLTEKIIQEEILKTKSKHPAKTSIEEMDNSIETIKNQDIPETNKKIHDR